jgi:hypothetical protein
MGYFRLRNFSEKGVSLKKKYNYKNHIAVHVKGTIKLIMEIFIIHLLNYVEL